MSMERIFECEFCGNKSVRKSNRYVCQNCASLHTSKGKLKVKQMLKPKER